jgi:nicotinamide mononucleotide (NMN) deamidase PncC
MVCFGWAVRARAPVMATRHLGGDRAGIRSAAVDVALAGLLELVEGAGPAR